MVQQAAPPQPEGQTIQHQQPCQVPPQQPQAQMALPNSIPLSD